jgi:hypothetical protein
MVGRSESGLKEGISLIKKTVISLLILGAVAAASVKIIFHWVYRGAQATVVYASPEQKDPRFIFCGMEMALPWSQISNVYADNHFHTIVFATDKQNRFSIMRLSTPERLPKTAHRTIKDKIEMFFVGDLGQLIIHPELMGQLYVPRPANVTWRSNPFSDLRTAMGFAFLRAFGGFRDLYEIDNAFMRGYHASVLSDDPHLSGQVNNLGMKDGTYCVNITMPENIEELSAPLLGSIRVLEVPSDFSQRAFERSRKLAQTCGSDPMKQKLALLTAIEAASNGPPNLAYFIHVLDLCRRFHVTRLSPAWLGGALHDFPSSQSNLKARFPELVPKDQQGPGPV